jgi:predicted RNase H-like HicB family nuclease
MASSRIIGKGTAIKILLFTEDIGPDGRYVITVRDAQGNPECNGFGVTREDAMGDLYKKGYQIVIDSFAKGDRVHWKTKRF